MKRAASLRLRKFRDREGAFLAEGADLVVSGIAAGRRPQVVFVRRGGAAEAAAAADALADGGPTLLAGLTVYPVSDRVAAKVSTLETPPDVMAVFPLPERQPLERLRGATAAPLVVYADGIADPGNMGTLMRAAAAFGAAALVAAPGTVDVFGPKTVRASMGAVFALPLYQDVTLAELVLRLGARHVYGLVAHGGAPLAGADLHRPAVLCVGAERAGISAAALPHVTDQLTIELAPARPGASPGAAAAAGLSPAVESLNAGVAGAIALYEFARRRRRRGAGTTGVEASSPAHHEEGDHMNDAQLAELGEAHPELAALRAEALAAVAAAGETAALEEARVRHLGRKSRLTEILRSISTLPAEQRPVVGKLGNLVRVELEQLIDEREAELAKAALAESLAHERIDVTLPGQPSPRGHEHLVSQTIREVEDIFLGLGYKIAEGPEVELDYYNFTALNTPEGHPARSSNDTFFVKPLSPDVPSGPGGTYPILLRTHTSPVQIRVMEAQRPPVYVICPGKVYRRDSDATHTPMFTQVEGLVVDEGITLADLKGTIHQFTREFFGPDRQIRLRPHFFPFTEPSIEIDVNCELCGGEGCRSCKYSGWLEIMGAGMVDPNVYGFVDYDPETVSGFAFGGGVERMAMLKYGIPDLRLFYDNDVRFLRQF